MDIEKRTEAEGLQPLIAVLGAMYGLIIPHMLSASVHRNDVNAFKGTIKEFGLEEAMELS